MMLRDRDRFASIFAKYSGDRAEVAAYLGVQIEVVEQWIRRHGLDDATRDA